MFIYIWITVLDSENSMYSIADLQFLYKARLKTMYAYLDCPLELKYMDEDVAILYIYDGV